MIRLVSLALRTGVLSALLFWFISGQSRSQKVLTFGSSTLNRESLRVDQKAKLKTKRLQRAFQQFKDDAQRLFVGSRELKERIQKSNPHIYSIGIVKKARELEKLAKKIKNRAKRGFD